MVCWAGDNGCIGGGRCGTEPRTKSRAGENRSNFSAYEERGRESKVIKSFWRPTIIKLEKMRNGNKELGVKFEKLSKAISNVIAEYKQTEYSVRVGGRAANGRG
jgi:hypothetical protein